MSERKKSLFEKGSDLLKAAESYDGKAKDFIHQMSARYFEADIKLETEQLINYELALILQGGGVKGLAYIGAIQELKKHINFDWYVGTSAGAITAAFLAADVNVDKLEEAFMEKSFLSFLEFNPFIIFYNIFSKGSLWSGKKIENFINKIISNHLEITFNSTFERLKFRLTVYASRKGKNGLAFDTLKNQDKEVSHAVKSSMAIPFVFRKESNDGYDTYDGGIQNNYPARIFREKYPNQPFIGLYLGSDEYVPNKKTGWAIPNIISMWLNSNDQEALRDFENETIIINHKPIGTLDFAMSQKSKKLLIKSGRYSAKRYLLKHNFITEDISNLKKELIKERMELIQMKKRKSFIWITIIAIIVIMVGIYTFWNYF